jgi:arginyl-tRNA synthetase
MNINQLITTLTTQFPFTWNLPPDTKLGLLTTNQAFILAKETKENPAILATNLCSDINVFFADNQMEFIANTAGPYININFNAKKLNSELLTIQKTVDLEKTDESRFIEYLSPNVGKKMHVGHIRTADIGESLRRIMALKYSGVISNNHLGDWGIQFGLLIWGIEHVKELGLGLQNVDWKNENADETVNTLQKIYVKVNELCETDENIRKQTQLNATILEQKLLVDEPDKTIEIWKQIIDVSIKSYTAGEGYLGLNLVTQNNENGKKSFDLPSNMVDKLGVWQAFETHKNGAFDLIIGESYYAHFITEIDRWVEAGIATQEGKAIYVDLEDQKLGRCYLVSSDGYSIYAARDVIARFVWAGVFGSTQYLSLVDNRQSHSIKQSFAVLAKILKAEIYKQTNFGDLSLNQTQKAVEILSQKQALVHVSFGFMSLPSGAMSTRTGNILLFETVKNLLEDEVERVLLTKNASQKQNQDFNQKVAKISVAALKWQDLSNDRDKDIVFDPAQVVKFEGNTGVYQLYTLARINNIVNKNETTSPLTYKTGEFLNELENEIMKKQFQLPYVLEQVLATNKPHILCNHLYEFTTLVNSWYACTPVGREENSNRRDALIQLCKKISNHIEICLVLLGIEPVETL